MDFWKPTFSLLPVNLLFPCEAEQIGRAVVVFGCQAYGKEPRLQDRRFLGATVRVPGWLSELEEELLPFVRDPIGATLKLGIRRLGEISSRFMTVDEMMDVANEAAAQCGEPGIRGCIVDKLWDGLRDRNGNCWIA